MGDSQLDQVGCRGSFGSALHRNCGIKVFTRGDSIFDLPDRYTFERHLGRCVCACKAEETGETVIVQKVTILEEISEARRVFREIRISRSLKHVNVLGISEIFAPDNYDDLTSVFFVRDFYPAKLSAIIHSPQPLTDDHFKLFIYQVLCGLKYIHSAHVLHRDLNPCKILVNRDCDLTICDVGLGKRNTTGCCITRWYDAPELLMLAKDYTSAIDIWSAGCIMAELLIRRPLFRGLDYVNQLECIINYLGTPTKEDLDAVSGNERAAKYVASLGGTSQHIRKRISAGDALGHPYFEEVRDLYNEPVADQPLDLTEFDLVERPQGEVKRLIWEEVQLFHTQQRRESQERHEREEEELRICSRSSTPCVS